MLHILLFILKIIGIILLAILILALLLLFFPVFYKLEGRKEKNEQYIKLRGGWLFHIIHFYFLYDEDIDYGIRIFGIKIKGKKDGEDTQIKSDESNKEETKENDYFIFEKTNDDKDSNQRISAIKKIVEQDEDGGSEENRSDEEKHSFFKEKPEKIKKILFQCKELFVRIVNRIKGIVKNIQDKYDSFQEFVLFLKSEETKTAYNYVKEKIIKLIRHIKPRRIRGQVAFGFDCPDKTGQTLGIIGMICGAANINLKDFKIDPDFENKRFEGEFVAKGYFLMGITGLYILQMYMKKEVKEIIDKF